MTGRGKNKWVVAILDGCWLDFIVSDKNIICCKRRGEIPLAELNFNESLTETGSGGVGAVRQNHEIVMDQARSSLF